MTKGSVLSLIFDVYSKPYQKTASSFVLFQLMLWVASQISRTKREQVVTTISNFKPKILLRDTQIICQKQIHSMDASNKNSKLIITFLCLIAGRVSI